MGVVHRATDTRLGRAVAIKALPDHLAADGERMARFEREARTLAALNHPNVAGIHGVEEHDGRRYLVLEFVEGQTLSAMLDRGPLPIDEALEICAQVAAGVEAAHEAGIVHRDLKPANVMVTPTGRAKVLDFGLARTEDAAGSSSSMDESPTMTTPPPSPTTPGVILGTAPYMSPEQARGRRVDKRTDIWSFGVLLYECLTGESPFRGETATDSIGAILHKGVDLDRLPAQTPPLVRRLIERCLERDRERRLRDIGDARLELEAARRGEGDGAAPEAAPAHTRGVLAGVAIGALALGAAGMWAAGRAIAPASPAQVERLSVVTPVNVLAHVVGVPVMALSPDGRTLVYVGGDSDGDAALYLRELGEFDARVLVRGEEVSWPIFSSDGQSVLFAAGQERIMRVSVRGGPTTTIATMPQGSETVTGLSIADGRVYFGAFSTNTVFSAPESGGEARVEAVFDRAASSTEMAQARIVSHFAALPGGDLLYVDSAFISPRRGEVRLRRAGSDESIVVVNDGMHPMPLPDGRLLFLRGEALMAARWDAKTGALLSEPQPVLEGVMIDRVTGTIHAAASATGDLCYVPGRPGGISIDEQTLVAFDRSGEPTPLSTRVGDFGQLDIAPDGRRAAMTRFETGSFDMSIWTLDLDRDLLTLLTAEPGGERDPVWSKDGRWVYYTAHTSSGPTGRFDGIRRRRADGAGEPETLYRAEREARIMAPLDDGARLLIVELPNEELAPGRASDISIVDLTGPAPVVIPWLATSADEGDAEPSPDGRWIAYGSTASGRSEVYLRQRDGDGARLQVSLAGGQNPEWARDGSELFYEQPDTGGGAGGAMLMAAPVTLPEGDLGAATLGTPVALHRRDALMVEDYEIFPDGRIGRISFPGGEQVAHTEIRLIRNFASLLPR
jgi:Tol biopolymer transport system component